MSRPVTVKVLGQPFRVDWIDVDDALSNRNHVGRTQTLKQLISVDTHEAGEDQQRDTLLHEILHASLRIAGGAGQSDAAEERVVALLTPILLDVLRSNPDVTGWLTE